MDVLLFEFDVPVNIAIRPSGSDKKLLLFPLIFKILCKLRYVNMGRVEGLSCKKEADEMRAEQGTNSRQMIYHGSVQPIPSRILSLGAMSIIQSANLFSCPWLAAGTLEK